MYSVVLRCWLIHTHAHTHTDTHAHPLTLTYTYETWYCCRHGRLICKILWTRSDWGGHWHITYTFTRTPTHIRTRAHTRVCVCARARTHTHTHTHTYEPWYCRRHGRPICKILCTRSDWDGHWCSWFESHFQAARSQFPLCVLTCQKTCK